MRDYDSPPEDGKRPSVVASYRLSSLLCTPSKLLEKLVFNKVISLLPVSNFQNNFMLLHFTTTILVALSQSFSKV